MNRISIKVFQWAVCLATIASFARADAPSTPTRGLTLDERVNHQRKIEEVYWRHRIWPKENPTAKPSLSQVMPDAVIRARVKDALKKSNALDNFRQRPITAEQLQAEMERMARDTRDGATLQELFRALGDDPQVIAETLARQSLVDREIPDLFPNDLADGSWSDIAQPAGFFTLPSVALTACRTDTWTPTSPSGITERYGHTSVWTGTELIVWGGYYAPSPSYLNTGGRYNPSTDSWTPTSIGSGVPGGRFSHTAVWTGTEIIVWGGLTAPGDVNTGGRYNPTNNAWLPTSTGTGVPGARESHTAVWTGTEMIVWGGWDRGAQAFLNGGARYSPVTNSWVAVSAGGNAPSARASHSATWTGAEMIVWGGLGFPLGSSALNTGGRYNPEADSWIATSMGSGLPSGRLLHTAVWTGTRLIVWGGGGNDSSLFDSGGSYDPASDTWASTSTGLNVPSARSSHSAIWSGSEMIVWGGYDDSDSGSGGRYSPLIDTWAPTGTGAGVPSPRSYHTGIWTGSEMIVWGGSNETGYVVDGSRYCPCATLGNYYRDADGDGYGDPATEVTICDVGGPPVGYAANNADCNDGESHIYSGAPEINDGIDNQCPGNPGFGLRDELAGVFGFLTAGDKTKLSWPAQSGATGYTVARSPYRDFHAGCRLIPTDVSNWSDLELPAPGTVYYYLVRAANPAAGTWGARSSGVERTVCNGCGSSADACDDGNACTDGDVCAGTTCVSGSARSCDDGAQCTSDGCNTASGCVHVNIIGGCDDANACTTSDTCAGGSCLGGPALNCDDSNPCTDDSCNPATGCAHTNNTSPCSDGSACTTGDACAAGVCVGGLAPNCADANPCTNDSCNPATGCVNANNTASCNDGNSCTTSDTCAGGSCLGGPALNCADANPCTNDSCNPATGCVNANNTASCNDGNTCTTSDTCAGGSCLGGPALNCNDNNPCTNDSCNPGSGCVHANNAVACDDGNGCTSGDVCSGGVCSGTLPPAANHLVISQIQVDGDGGVPLEDEFIELYNPTFAAISLNGWSLQFKTNAGAATYYVHPFGGSGATVPAHGWFLVARADYNGAVPANQTNTTFPLSVPGTVFLVSNTTLLSGTCSVSASIVDKVAYGGGNCPEGTAEAAPSSNNSILRLPGGACGNGTDTNSNSSDFTSRSPSTPRNASSTPEPPLPPATHLVISQIQLEGDGATPLADEFVEIYNPTSAPISLNGKSLQLKTTGGGGAYSVHPFGASAGNVPAHGWFLLAGSAYNGSVIADQAIPEFAIPTGGGQLFLVNDAVSLSGACSNASTIIDKVGYGTGSCPEGTAVASPSANNSVVRKPGGSNGNGTDTNDNALDFAIQTPSTPRNSASPPQP